MARKHQTALTLVRTYDAISLENLRVANLIGNQQVAKSLLDAGRAALRTILTPQPAGQASEWCW